MNLVWKWQYLIKVGFCIGIGYWLSLFVTSLANFAMQFVVQSIVN